jgi:hypothetical protein
MSNRYPPPPVRPRVTPGKGSPLRQWAAASYSPLNGFQASGLDGSAIHGQQPSAQPVREDSGFQARDRRATQNPTPVRMRKIG